MQRQIGLVLRSEDGEGSDGQRALVLPQEFLEGGREVGFDEAREGLGDEVVEIGGTGSVEAFQGLDGLDCFDAQDSAFHQRSTVRPRAAAPHRNVSRRCGGGGGRFGCKRMVGFKERGVLGQSGKSHG